MCVLVVVIGKNKRQMDNFPTNFFKCCLAAYTKHMHISPQHGPRKFILMASLCVCILSETRAQDGTYIDIVCMCESCFLHIFFYIEILYI